MEPSKEAITVRITRLNRQILGKVTSGTSKFSKRTLDREALLDALTVLYDECNDDPVKKTDELVRAFVDKYRSTLADLRRTRVCYSDFEVLQTIGRGYFGEVHMVKEKQTGDVYALKTLRKEQARKQEITSVEDERDVLATAISPWLPRLQYAFQDSNNLYLVMEMCYGGDLAGLLARRNHPLSERDAAFYVAEVAHALKALHGMGYVHRDVKPHNVLLDRCGHVKLGDLGSVGRLSDGGAATAAGTPDYVAPELLAAAHCAATHSVCLQYCGRVVTQAISACDYWSLGVVAFELVTLKRPFSKGDEDSMIEILSNIQKYERDPAAEPPFDPPPSGPSAAWRSLVGGLLRVQPARRYSYLDTLQHQALAHVAVHSIRDQVPPWVPLVRGAEDSSWLCTPPRRDRPPSATPFRTRPPFAGQLPFVGYSFVAPEDNDDSSGGFNASHDCTAIDLATFKSIEKLAAMRSREITSLQNQVAAAEASASAAVERVRRDLECDAERQRVRLQADITALTLQNKRLERQVEVEKEERMALQRSNQELSSGIAERNNIVAREARAEVAQLQAERDGVREDMRRLEARVEELQAECARAVASADAQRAQHQHYKDSVAKERAIRRQTLSGGDAEVREAGVRLAAAEANTAREVRARELVEKRLATLQDENRTLQDELDKTRRELASARDSLDERQRDADTSSEQLKEVQQQLAQERFRVSTLQAQVQELERGVEESVRRETSLEEQCARTESRLHERLEAAEGRAANALQEDARHREKVNTLEQLVRQLEREVTALETRGCTRCATRAAEEQARTTTGTNTSTRKSTGTTNTETAVTSTTRKSTGTTNTETPVSSTTHVLASAGPSGDRETVRGGRDSSDTAKGDSHSDTESLADAVTASAAQAQLALLKEQLERAEAQLQARAEEIATLRQETRAANLARWRKEREYNELSVEAKSSARDLKRVEERLSTAIEARKSAEQKAAASQKELTTLRPQYDTASAEAARLREQLDKLKKVHEVAQAEVDRSRNDIRKLKSELQYSEKRRIHAEEQEELSSRERAQLRDELHQVRQNNTELVENNKALQEACSLLEDQLTDLERLTDIHEVKNQDLEGEVQRMRAELESSRARVSEAERVAAERAAAAHDAALQQQHAQQHADHTASQLQLLQERVESRSVRVSELETAVAALEGERAARDAALRSAARRTADLMEEAAALRTRAHHHHQHALALQAQLAEVQEELAGAREAAEAATAWWRTREAKSDATLRQQTKLIDFLQAKVEEANRKKCSLSNKLFGRSGRRNAASPPLRRANRELREEVERLRAKLTTASSSGDASFPPTPRKEKPKPTANGFKSMDSFDVVDEHSLQIVWPDGVRERFHGSCSNGELILTNGDKELRAKLHSADPKNLPQNESNRGFTIKLCNSALGSSVVAAAVCDSIASRASWVSRLSVAAALSASPRPGYAAPRLASLPHAPLTALYVAPNVLAIGCTDGLHSLRSGIDIVWDEPPPHHSEGGVGIVSATCGRVLVVCHGALCHAGLMQLESTTRRASTLRPALTVAPVALPDANTPHLIKALSDDTTEGPCAAVASGRRVFLLRFDAAASEFKIFRSLTVDRPPNSLLLTTRCLYVAGEKPLKINLPSGALESFAMDELTVAAAARKHSPPKAILLIRDKPLEILLCYAECGVFVDENGRRTRNEDPKWSSAVHGWEFVNPFLYLVGHEKVTILYINEEVYKAPPCTCDTASLTSTETECCNSPQIFNLKLQEPQLLGTAPNGIIIRSKTDDGYEVSVVEGMPAFRSIGASVESLETISDNKGSSSDLAQSMSDLSPQEVSQESVEATTGFLADIRKKARQLRLKNRNEQSADDVIKEILTTEVGLKRLSTGRISLATNSEFDSDSTESEERTTNSTKCTADVCAEIFARQVRFQ